MLTFNGVRRISINSPVSAPLYEVVNQTTVLLGQPSVPHYDVLKSGEFRKLPEYHLATEREAEINIGASGKVTLRVYDLSDQLLAEKNVEYSDSLIVRPDMDRNFYVTVENPGPQAVTFTMAVSS